VGGIYLGAVFCGLNFLRGEAGVFQGGFEKSADFVMVFCGRNVVVKCRFVVLSWPYFVLEKCAGFLKYFCG
jgi:hypothetical protein